MPEKPEVITVAKKLELRLMGRKIERVSVLWDNIIEGISPKEFEDSLKGQEFLKVTTRGKWIVFELSSCLLLAHLRMEGKFFYRTKNDPIGKHEHVVFYLDKEEELRFSDVRKFGKMRILPKVGYQEMEPFSSLGLEPWSSELTPSYLISKWSKKTLPIKSALLEQNVITGLGNIYADEVLFLSKIHPLTPAKDLTEEACLAIIKKTRVVLDQAIKEGGTTIRSYTSEEGVTGLYQNHLYVHQRENDACRVCKSPIQKIKVGGRSTYFCSVCQSDKKK